MVLVVKNPPANAGNIRNMGSDLGWEDPLEEAWQPAPVFMPGESYGQKSLVSYSPEGGKESDTK